MSGFEQALLALKEDKRITRTGWNDKSMFAYYVPAGSGREPPALPPEKYEGIGEFDPNRGYFALQKDSDQIVVWIPSFDDMLAEDWKVL